MADTIALGRRRTVRFSAELDRLLESRAAAQNKTVSDIVRIAVKTGIENTDTAGDWLLKAAGKYEPRADSAERLAFQKAYREKHRP